MKTRIFLLSLVAALPLAGFAQVDDDLYFVPKKETRVEHKTAEPRARYFENDDATFDTGCRRDVDEYNRRGGHRRSLCAMDSTRADSSCCRGDYEMTHRLRRYHDVPCGDLYDDYYDPVDVSINVYSPWLWGGFYRPWYAGWYDPWYGGWGFGLGWGYGWYDPWWYGGWGYPAWHGGWGHGYYASGRGLGVYGARYGGRRGTSYGTSRSYTGRGGRLGTSSASRGGRVGQTTGRSSFSRATTSSPRRSVSTPTRSSSMGSRSSFGSSRGSFGGGSFGGGSRGGGGRGGR